MRKSFDASAHGCLQLVVDVYCGLLLRELEQRLRELVFFAGVVPVLHQSHDPLRIDHEGRGMRCRVEIFSRRAVFVGQKTGKMCLSLSVAP